MSDFSPWRPSPSPLRGAKLQLSQKLIIEALIAKLSKMGTENANDAARKLRSSFELQSDLLRLPDNLVLLLAAIKRGASMEVLEPYLRSVREGRNIIHHAVARHRASLLLQLLPAGELINKPDNEGLTPLAIAIISSPDCIQLLVDSGADVNAQIEGESLLFRAISASHVEAPLLPQLLRAGANPNARDLSGRTLLMNATTASPAIRSEEAMALLLRAGSNAQTQDPQGLTALHHLLSPKLQYDDASLLRRLNMLLSYLANVNAVTREGNTPLHTLCGPNRIWHRKTEAVVWSALIREGANPWLLNNAGKSACDLWRQVSRSAIPVLPPNKTKIP